MRSKLAESAIRTVSALIVAIAVITTPGAATPAAASMGCNSVYCEAGTVCPGESFLEGWCTVSAQCPNSTPGCAENFGNCNPGLAIRCNVFVE